jgi:photosystem II stability/assembly factor-like uncharacterized protein
MSFADATNGWMAACDQKQASFLWRTSDGAKTWRRIASSSPTNGQCNRVTALDFVDTSHGFTSFGPAIYRTADGGATWPPQAQLSGPGSGLPVDGVYAIKTFGSVHLALAQAGNAQFVFRSIDGAEGWSYLATIPSGFDNAVGLLTASRWVQLLPGQGVETTDAGKTWHRYPSDYSGEMLLSGDIVFGDVSVGYAQTRGSIQRTEDGGLHWTPIHTPGTALVTPAAGGSGSLSSPLSFTWGPSDAG